MIKRFSLFIPHTVCLLCIHNYLDYKLNAELRKALEKISEKIITISHTPMDK